jgi:hypothetical protein
MPGPWLWSAAAAAAESGGDPDFWGILSASILSSPQPALSAALVACDDGNIPGRVKPCAET